MGNRAAIVFANKDFTEFSPTVYVHWNGGPESIYPFLDELDRREVRADQDYECARFIAIVSEFMDQDHYTGLSLGVWNGPKTLKEAAKISDDCGSDNGVYVVSREGKRIVRRFFREGREMPAPEVARERDAAYRHKYNTGETPLKSIFTKQTESEAYAAKRAKV